MDSKPMAEVMLMIQKQNNCMRLVLLYVDVTASLKWLIATYTNE